MIVGVCCVGMLVSGMVGREEEGERTFLTLVWRLRWGSLWLLRPGGRLWRIVSRSMGRGRGPF